MRMDDKTKEQAGMRLGPRTDELREALRNYPKPLEILERDVKVSIAKMVRFILGGGIEPRDSLELGKRLDLEIVVLPE